MIFLLLLAAQLNYFEITQISSPQVVGESVLITIITRDVNGNIYNYNRPAFLTTNRGAYVFPNVVGPFRNGVWQGRVILTLADSLQLRCTDDSLQVTSGSNFFTVLPGSPARFVVILPGQTLRSGTREGRLGTPEYLNAGEEFNFQVFLTDLWCNPVRFRIDSVYFIFSDSFARFPFGGVINDGVGDFIATFRQAGYHRILVLPSMRQNYRPDTSSELIVNAGVFSRLLLLLPGERHLPGDTTMAIWQTPGKAGEPLRQYVKESFSVTVYPCDECWNRVSISGLTVSLQSDFSAEFVPGEMLLSDSAVFSVKFNFAGDNQNIWVTEQNGQYESYRTFLDIKARGRVLEISIAPNDTINLNETTYINVRVRDANFQPITAAVCRFSVLYGSGKMLDETVLTDTLGSAVARFICSGAWQDEFDTIMVSSGTAESSVVIYVKSDTGFYAVPNPFGFNSDAVAVYYTLPRDCPIELRIFDPFGNEVYYEKFLAGRNGGKAGRNRVIWNGRNLQHRRVASGIYVVQILGEMHTGIIVKKSYRLGVVW